jgi:hypothetical protein
LISGIRNCKGIVGVLNIFLFFNTISILINHVSIFLFLEDCTLYKKTYLDSRAEIPIFTTLAPRTLTTCSLVKSKEGTLAFMCVKEESKCLVTDTGRVIYCLNRFGFGC